MLDAPSNLYDLIIVDQKMPNLTGVELVDAIRKRGIPGNIIVLSAQISPEIREAYERDRIGWASGFEIHSVAWRSAGTSGSQYASKPSDLAQGS